MGKFPDSAFAHRYLDNFGCGVEIGGSAHNQWNLVGSTIINVDYTNDMDNEPKQAEFNVCGEKLPVHVVAEGDDLPFRNNTFDFLVNSHVIEHFPNPLRTINEWIRVVRHGGRILFNVPDRDSSNPVDKLTPYTTIEDVRKYYIERRRVDNCDPPPGHGVRGHYTQWSHESFIEMIKHFYDSELKIIDSLAPDDKVGNGFMVICEVL